MSIATAVRAAQSLVERLQIRAPPVDVEAVAQSLGLRVFAGDLGEGVSGLLVTNATERYVCVQRADHIHRRRFTIGHECGHHYLGHQFEAGSHVHVDRGYFISRRSAASSTGMDIKEIEANQFAAALLMPEALVRAACGAWTGGLPDFEVARLASAFNVSEQAMTFRLNRLRLL